MNDVRRSLTRLLRRRPTQRRAAAGQHPTPEVLAAYHADELRPEDDEVIQEHFLHCRECPEVLLDLKQFATLDRTETDVLSDSVVGSAWQAVRSRLSREPRLPGTSLPVRRWLSSLRFAQGFSIALLAASVGLGVWVAVLRTELHRLDEPQVNVTVATLSAATRGGGHGVRIEVPPGARRFLLVVVPARDSVAEEYWIEIVSATGHEVWRGRLTRGDEGTLSVEMSRHSLAAGDYVVLVVGTGDAARLPPEEYPIHLSYR